LESAFSRPDFQPCCNCRRAIRERH
jgi:hypothetical protein